MTNTTEAALFYRRFLFGLALVILACTATVWHYLTIGHALAFLAGSTTVLAYSMVAPTYEPADPDATEPDPDRGFN